MQIRTIQSAGVKSRVPQLRSLPFRAPRSCPRTRAVRVPGSGGSDFFFVVCKVARERENLGHGFHKRAPLRATHETQPPDTKRQPHRASRGL
eukprot:4317479-Pyramimonas_sp.AAC.1